MDPPACYSEQKATVETAADTGLLGGRWPHPPWLQGVDEYGDVLWAVLRSANKPSWGHTGSVKAKQRPLSHSEAAMRDEGTHKPCGLSCHPILLVA